MSKPDLLTRTFRRVYRSSQWTRRRFTPAGRFLLGLLVFAGVLGVDTRINLVHQTFALVLVALSLSLLFGLGFRHRFSVERRLPRYATVGQPCTYEVLLRCDAERPQLDLHLSEQLRLTYPAAGRDPQDPVKRNWFDRQFGYPRWAEKVLLSGGALEPEAQLQRLEAGEAARLQLQITPLRRGWIHFEHLQVARADPLGLYLPRQLVASPDRLLVLPRRYPIGNIQLPGRQDHQSGDSSSAARLGDSSEFVGLRDYRPGDPMRKLHWRSIARVDRAVVREYEDDFYTRHGLILDSFGAEDQFEAAVSVAASLLVRLDTHHTAIDLFVHADRVLRLTSHQGAGGSERLLQLLASVQATPQRDFADLQRAVTARASLLSSCICVLLDWDEPRQRLADSLQANGMDRRLLVICPRERRPPQAPAELRFIDPMRLAQDLASLT